MTVSRRFLLWFGVFGAPAAWLLHLIAGWIVDEAACSAGSTTFFSGGRPALVATSAVTLALALAGLAAAAFTVRAVRRGDVPDPRGRVEFLGLAGAGASVFFLLVTALASTWILSLDVCRPG